MSLWLKTIIKPKIYRGLQLLFLVGLITLSSWLFHHANVKSIHASNELCAYHEEVYQGLDVNKLTQELQGTGLIGSIHGAVASSQLFVLSVREPTDFFNHREFSLIPTDEKILTRFAQVQRHDRVCIQGRLLENPSPQKHILVKSLKILEKQPDISQLPPYERDIPLPAQLRHSTSLVGKVHAIAQQGQILVVEYQDGIFPLFVESPELTKNLFRGDIIELSYRLQDYPQKPTHLQLNLATKNPIKVIDAIAAWHDQEKVLTGKLVKFPQSPQIQFDVYALEIETQGVKRNFTLVNFEDEQEFEKIRTKLAKIWEDNLKTVKNSRNSLINPDVILEVRGRINVVSPEQANPQILLNSIEDIRLAS